MQRRGPRSSCARTRGTSTLVTLTAKNTTRYADANGLRIHYHEAGSGPPLVCVAATAFGATAWGQNRSNIGALSQHFHTMLVNLPPQGDSDKQVKSDAPRLDFYAEVLRDFMDALGIDWAHFYGGSPGAGPVLKLATLHPERIGRIVVDAPTGVGKSLFNPMPVEGASYTAAFGREPTMERLREVMDIQISRPELREEAIQLRYSAAHAPGYKEARNNITGPMENLLNFLKHVQAPTLIIWGAADRDVPLDRGLAAMWEIPSARLHLFGAGCGHWPQYERADEWNRLVIRFLND